MPLPVRKASEGEPVEMHGARKGLPRAAGAVALAARMRVVKAIGMGLLRELNPGPLAPEARIMPLDQAAS